MTNYGKVKYALERLKYTQETLEDFIKYSNRAGQETEFALKCLNQAIAALNSGWENGKN